MKAIFNKKCELVGWYNAVDGMVFDTNMSWIGFVKKDYFYSKKAKWLGGLFNNTIVDKNGKPVGWLEGNNPKGTIPLLEPLIPFVPIRPLTPMRPLMPLQPLRPLTPIGGWSDYDWTEFIRQ